MAVVLAALYSFSDHLGEAFRVWLVGLITDLLELIALGQDRDLKQRLVPDSVLLLLDEFSEHPSGLVADEPVERRVVCGLGYAVLRVGDQHREVVIGQPEIALVCRDEFDEVVKKLLVHARVTSSRLLPKPVVRKYLFLPPFDCLVLLAQVVGLDKLHSDVIKAIKGAILPGEEFGLLLSDGFASKLVVSSRIEGVDCVVGNLASDCVQLVLARTALAYLHEERLAVRHKKQEEVHRIEIGRLQLDPVADFFKELGSQGSVLQRDAKLLNALHSLVKVLAIQGLLGVFSVLHDLDNDVDLEPAFSVLHLVESMEVQQFELQPERVPVDFLLPTERLLEDSYRLHLRLACLVVVGHEAMEDDEIALNVLVRQEGGRVAVEGLLAFGVEPPEVVDEVSLGRQQHGLLYPLVRLLGLRFLEELLYFRLKVFFVFEVLGEEGSERRRRDHHI